MKRGDFVFRAEDFCKQLLIIILVNGDQQLKILVLNCYIIIN